MNSSDNDIVTDSNLILEKHVILVNLHKYISNPHPIMIFFCIILSIAAMANTTMQLEKLCFPWLYWPLAIRKYELTKKASYFLIDALENFIS